MLIALIFYSTFVAIFASPTNHFGEETLYDLQELEPLNGNNYRQILGLGKVKEIVEFDFEGKVYRTEETYDFDATFVINDGNVVISGEYIHQHDLGEGNMVGALSRISIDSEGKHTRKITSDHNGWSQMDSDERKIDTAWWSEAKRRSLGGYVEYSVQYLYTEKALTKAGSVDQLKANILQGVGDCNIAYANTGLDIVQVPAGITKWEGGAIGPDWRTDFVAKFDEKDRQGDIVVIVVDWGEGPDNYCGEADSIPVMDDPYSKSTAFIILWHDCINDGRYVPAHEIGHLMGLGHNYGTTHVTAGYTGVGNILRCGNGGLITIMSYSSAEMYGSNWVIADSDFQCTEAQKGTEKVIPYFSGLDVFYIEDGHNTRTGSAKANAKQQIINSLSHLPGYDADTDIPWCATINAERWAANAVVPASPNCPTAKHCQELCQRHAACEWWVYLSASKDCHFHGASATFYDNRPGYIVGPKDCEVAKTASIELPRWPQEFSWNVAGAPAGRNCVAIKEPQELASHTWNDNFLCSSGNRADPGIVWSSSGAVRGMKCTQIDEPDAPHAYTWYDNWLCVPETSPYKFSWSSTGPIAGKDCMLWLNVGSSWQDNYLCGEVINDALPKCTNPTVNPKSGANTYDDDREWIDYPVAGFGPRSPWDVNGKSHYRGFPVTLDQCLAACAHTIGCRAYSYDTELKQCWLANAPSYFAASIVAWNAYTCSEFTPNVKEYEFGTTGTANCASGSTLVTNEVECRSAAVTSFAGKSFLGTGCYSFAQGCLSNGSGVYYSTCTSTIASHHIPICKYETSHHSTIDPLERKAFRLATHQKCGNEGSNHYYAKQVTGGITKCLDFVESASECGRYFNFNSADGWCKCVPKGKTCDMSPQASTVEIWERINYYEHLSLQVKGHHDDEHQFTCGAIAAALHGSPTHCNYEPANGRRLLQDALGETILHIEVKVADLALAQKQAEHPEFLDSVDSHPNVTINGVIVPPVDCVLGPKVDKSECTWCGEVLTQHVNVPEQGAGVCHPETYTCGHHDGFCDFVDRNWELHYSNMNCHVLQSSDISSTKSHLDGCLAFCDDYTFATYHLGTFQCQCTDECENPLETPTRVQNIVYSQTRDSTSAPTTTTTTESTKETMESETSSTDFYFYGSIVCCTLIGLILGFGAKIAFDKLMMRKVKGKSLPKSQPQTSVQDMTGGTTLENRESLDL